MDIFSLLAIAVGLSMDAFAVAVCKGLSVNKISAKHQLIVGLYFGGFQALMPLIGYYLGIQFEELIKSVDHWICFFLLALIGINMIREAFGDDEEIDDLFNPKSMFPLAIATSIDALAVGVTLAFLSVNILPAVSFIGAVTFVLSVVGLWVGNIFGCKYKSKAEVAGGVVLILMGMKILFEHLGIL